MSDTIREDTVGGVPVRVLGDRGPTTLLLSGPLAGATLFRAVQERMSPRRTLALDLVASGASGLDELAERAQSVVDETGAPLVFAHGLAVPVACRLRCDHLVVSNGPLTRLDPVSRTLARCPAVLLHGALLRPTPMRRWLSSSFGLRRTVNNPYVMDRDIVVMLTERLAESAENREVAAAWIRALRSRGALVAPKALRISAIWGDHDALYPLDQVKGLDHLAELQVISGGRHFHVEERPWEVADRLMTLSAT